LIVANRIVGRLTASQIASASRARECGSPKILTYCKSAQAEAIGVGGGIGKKGGAACLVNAMK
jgi:hypothetical protein